MNHAPGIINLDPCPVHLVDTSTPPTAPPGTLHEPTLRAVIEAIAETQSRKEAIALIESLAGRALKSLDDPHLQQLFGDAIEGALALGYQGTNAPPPGHWLQRFWDIGRAEAKKAPSETVAAVTVSEAPPAGWKSVPVQPTAGIIAAAAIAVWPTASAADIALAREAAPLVLMQSDLAPGFTVETLAAALATMAPAYRAMIAAAPLPEVSAQQKGGA